MGTGVPNDRMVGSLSLSICDELSLNATRRDQSGVTFHPIRVNSGKLDVTADIFLAPFVEVALELCRS